jgi:hypothetical protein
MANRKPKRLRPGFSTTWFCSLKVLPPYDGGCRCLAASEAVTVAIPFLSGCHPEIITRTGEDPLSVLH